MSAFVNENAVLLLSYYILIRTRPEDLVFIASPSSSLYFMDLYVRKLLRIYGTYLIQRKFTAILLLRKRTWSIPKNVPLNNVSSNNGKQQRAKSPLWKDKEQSESIPTDATLLRVRISVVWSNRWFPRGSRPRPSLWGAPIIISDIHLHFWSIRTRRLREIDRSRLDECYCLDRLTGRSPPGPGKSRYFFVGGEAPIVRRSPHGKTCILKYSYSKTGRDWPTLLNLQRGASTHPT